MGVVTRADEAGLGTTAQGFAIVVDGLRKRYGSLVAVDFHFWRALAPLGDAEAAELAADFVESAAA